MKNKKNIYILLPLVLLIWGLVIYKFFTLTGTEENATTDTAVVVKPLQITKPKPLVINADYRDPFLGKVYSRKASKINTKSKPPNRVTTIQPIIWPQVIYKGMVSDQKNRKKVFMVLVNGQIHLAKENETIGDITVKKGNRKSIDIKYKGDVTTILLEE